MSSKSSNPNNPYASAAKAYGQNAQTNTNDPREVEARVLLKSANQLQALQGKWDSMTHAELDEALTYNRNIWMMFVDTAIEDNSGERPMALRNNIANLGIFIFKQTVDILADPRKEKLSILIEINREIAAGLLSRPPGPGGGTAAPAG